MTNTPSLSLPVPPSTPPGRLSPEQRVAELSRSKGETQGVIRSLGTTLEEVLPGAAVIICKLNKAAQTLKPIFTSSQLEGTPLSHEHRATDGTPHGYAVMHGEDVTIFNLHGHPHSAELNLSSVFDTAVVRRIKPSNGDCWGCIAAYFQKSDQSSEEERRTVVRHNDVWLQLAATIIERRLLDDLLHTAQIRSDLAAQAAGIGIFDWNIETNDLFWSPEAFRVYGKEEKPNPLSYHDWASITNTEDLLQIESNLQHLFKCKERSFQSLSRFRRSSGEERWAKTIGEIIYDQAGTPMRMIGTAQDVTETLKAEEQKYLDRRRLELALEAGELGFWDWHIPTDVVQFGGQWESILGYSPDEMPPHAHDWEERVHPDDIVSVRERLTKHLEGKSPLYESEHRLKAKDGSWVWVLHRGRVVERDEQGRAIRALGTHSDISQKRAVQERLQEADRRKDEFLATLAHELRNPLAPIRTGLAILQKDCTPSQAAKAREMMERQLVHMVRLVDDLLDVSRITTGRLTLKKDRHSARSIIEAAVEASRPLIDAAHHTLTVTSVTPDVEIYCDATRVAQTISNILTNAAKYTPDGGRIDLVARRDETSLQISISDNGLGIPPDMIDHIFDLFGQVNRTLHRSQGGLGIGLALVKTLLNLHGGSISVVSPGINQGSTFTITLPLGNQSQAQALRQHGSQATGEGMTQKRVLIVDDNVDGAESLAIFTELLGHKPEIAHSGPEALAKIPSYRPDVILLDIGLPGMSGFEVAEIIRTTPQGLQTKLVALTGWGSEETKRRAHESGFNEHLTKPVELTDIERILSA